MRATRNLAAVGGLFLFALAEAGAPIASAQGGLDVPKRTVTCSFSNPGYSGYCKQNADVPAGSTGRRSCGKILRCLNDVRCVASYCDGTQIRIDWKLVKVEKADTAAPPR